MLETFVLQMEPAPHLLPRPFGAYGVSLFQHCLQIRVNYVIYCWRYADIIP